MNVPGQLLRFFFVFAAFVSLLIFTRAHSDGAAEAGSIDGDKSSPDESFFLLCSGGEAEKLKSILDDRPEWVDARTINGETCLHLTGILGQTEVTKLLLDKGADPNIRSTFKGGLRMHPLSWNVYGNHFDNAKLLLEHGADVNADFDLEYEGKKEVVTVLDIVALIKGDTNDYDEIEELLKKHGAKTQAEIKSGQDL